jgi:hypothetical protein
MKGGGTIDISLIFLTAKSLYLVIKDINGKDICSLLVKDAN